MDIRQSDRGRRAQVALVAVETVTSDDADAETIAAQWAQEIRHRVAAHGVETGAAVAVLLDGTMHTLSDALRAPRRRCLSAGSVPIPVEIVGGADTLVMLARIVNALEGTGARGGYRGAEARSLGASLSGRRRSRAARQRDPRSGRVLRGGAGRGGGARGGAHGRTAAAHSEQHAPRARLPARGRRRGRLRQRDADDAARNVAGEPEHPRDAERLDALARVGMARAVDAGKNVEEVFDSIADSVVEGGEELEKFGSSLHGVADDSHTASDRLSALVARGREVTPAIRTAADEVARFRNELQRAQRTISEGSPASSRGCRSSDDRSARPRTTRRSSTANSRRRAPRRRSSSIRSATASAP